MGRQFEIDFLTKQKKGKNGQFLKEKGKRSLMAEKENKESPPLALEYEEKEVGPDT